MLPKNKLGRAQGKKLKVYRRPGPPACRPAAQAVRDREGREAVSEEFVTTPISTRPRRPRGPEGDGRDRADGRPAQGGGGPGADHPRQRQFLLNGKSLEEYFPNKVHQQLIREPLVILEKSEAFDIRANLNGGGITGRPVRCAWPSPAR